MTTVQHYFHLQSSTMSPCTMSRSNIERAKGDWLCAECSSVIAEKRPIDVQIQEESPHDGPLTFVGSAGLSMCHIQFLNQLPSKMVNEDLLVGEVRNSNGEILSDWVTFRGRIQLIIRGTKNVSYRKCESCNGQMYFAMGKRYLFPRPPSSHEIFESDLHGIVVSEQVFKHLALPAGGNLAIEKLTVLTVPKDGLGELR